jgi:hypothetical protein
MMKPAFIAALREEFLGGCIVLKPSNPTNSSLLGQRD